MSSVKEQVIALASQDPFLTVEELAKKAETTPPYVRTILSEANLSLHQMRKDYARSLELRLGQKGEEKLVFQANLEVKQILSQDLPEAVPQWKGKKLFQIAEMGQDAAIPNYTQLITPLPLTIIEEYTTLRDFLPLAKNELVPMQQNLRLRALPSGLAELFARPAGSQVLKLSTLLHNQAEPVAYEIKWLAPEGLVLTLTPEERELRILESG